MNRLVLVVFPTAVLLGGLGARCSRGDELAPRYQTMTDKGLRWLAGQQHRDGHWEATGIPYRSAMTGMAGLALLMEGSTPREGKYARNIRKAVDWLMENTHRSGLIGESDTSKVIGYMHGHGFALLFLSQVYGEEEDSERRRKLQDVLTRAVGFTCRAQTPRGGWGYVSSADGDGFDEGSVTVTQVQALRAARNAGIAVPVVTIDKVHEYLSKCTSVNGGLLYSLAKVGAYGGGEEKPAITVAATASLFGTGEYNSPLAKKWLKFVQPVVPLDRIGAEKFGEAEYTHYYFSQVIYMLGEDGYEKLFPTSRLQDRLTWSGYKKVFFPYLARTQHADGSWTGTYLGSVYTTACYLTILQLEKGALPFYQR